MSVLEHLRRLGRWGHRAHRAPQMARITYHRTPSRAERQEREARARLHGGRRSFQVVPVTAIGPDAAATAPGPAHRGEVDAQHTV